MAVARKGTEHKKYHEMKYQIEYMKDGFEISIYKNVQLVGKFPNLSERDPNKGFQAINEHGEPRRFCYDKTVSIIAQ